MAEAMTVETIVEAEWQLYGYWTKLRFPLEVTRGWSDVDVLAYHPEKRHLVIAESKVGGRKKAVWAQTTDSKPFRKGLLSDPYFLFLNHVKLICEPDVIFADFKKQVKELTRTYLKFA